MRRIRGWWLVFVPLGMVLWASQMSYQEEKHPTVDEFGDVIEAKEK